MVDVKKRRFSPVQSLHKQLSVAETRPAQIRKLFDERIEGCIRSSRVERIDSIGVNEFSPRGSCADWNYRIVTTAPEGMREPQNPLNIFEIAIPYAPTEPKWAVPQTHA